MVRLPFLLLVLRLLVHPSYQLHADIVCHISLTLLDIID